MSSERVADIMTRDPVRLDSCASASVALKSMRRSGLAALPVVDSSGALLGMVASADLLNDTEAHVRDFITDAKLVVDADTPAFEAVGLMLERSTDSAPVIDRGILVGTVTRQDVLKAFSESGYGIAL